MRRTRRPCLARPGPEPAGILRAHRPCNHCARLGACAPTRPVRMFASANANRGWSAWSVRRRAEKPIASVISSSTSACSASRARLGRSSCPSCRSISCLYSSGARPISYRTMNCHPTVWAGVVVSPETVTKRVNLLREALGDDSANPRYIAGLRSRGYRISAPVSREELAPAPTSPSALAGVPTTDAAITPGATARRLRVSALVRSRGRSGPDSRDWDRGLGRAEPRCCQRRQLPPSTTQAATPPWPYCLSKT